MKARIGILGVSMLEGLIGLAMISVGLLAFVQFAGFSARSARSSAVSAQFNQHGAVLKKIVKFPAACTRVFAGKQLVSGPTVSLGAITPPSTIGAIELDGASGSDRLLALNEEFNGLRLVRMAFTDVVQDLGIRQPDGHHGWLATFRLVFRKVVAVDGSNVGGALELATDVTIPVFMESSNNIIRDCG